MGMHKATARGLTESPAMQALIDWLEDYSEDMLAMLVRAFTVTVMCLAMRVLSEYIYDDVGEHAIFRFNILFAGFMTLVGSVISVSLEKMELNLMPAQGPPHVLTPLCMPVLRRRLGDTLSLGKPRGIASTAIELSNLTQSILSWIAGSASGNCRSLIFPVFAATQLSPGVFATCLGLTVLFCIIAAVGLALTAHKGEARDDDRATVERYYITNLIGFFVGWCAPVQPAAHCAASPVPSAPSVSLPASPVLSAPNLIRPRTSEAVGPGVAVTWARTRAARAPCE